MGVRGKVTGAAPWLVLAILAQPRHTSTTTVEIGADIRDMTLYGYDADTGDVCAVIAFDDLQVYVAMGENSFNISQIYDTKVACNIADGVNTTITLQMAEDSAQMNDSHVFIHGVFHKDIDQGNIWGLVSLTLSVGVDNATDDVTSWNATSAGLEGVPPQDWWTCSGYNFSDDLATASFERFTAKPFVVLNQTTFGTDSVVCPADVVNPPSETGEYTVGRIVGLVIAGVAAVMLVTMVLGYRKDGQRNTGYVTINN